MGSSETMSDRSATTTQQTPFAAALTQYQKVYLAARNLSARTRREYTADLTALIRFLHTHGAGVSPHGCDAIPPGGLSGAATRRCSAT